MIKNQTILKVLDNSGAKYIMCIHMFNKPEIKVGDIIVGVIKKAIPNLSIKRSQIIKALVVRTKKPIIRKDGSIITFSDNGVILLNKEGNPIGNRMFGPFALEIKKNKKLKISILSSYII